MAVNPSIDPARLLEEQLSQASPDLLRELLGMFINTLLWAEANAVCGAEYGTTSPERVNRCNGYRHRDFDTRAGTLDVAIPKLRSGSYFPEWLLERRKRAERALTSVVATCYLLGVSTRRMDRLVASLGITSLSKSQVSEMAKELDAHVEQFRTRSLAEAGRSPSCPATRWCSRGRTQRGQMRALRPHIRPCPGPYLTRQPGQYSPSQPWAAPPRGYGVAAWIQKQLCREVSVWRDGRLASDKAVRTVSGPSALKALAHPLRVRLLAKPSTGGPQL